MTVRGGSHCFNSKINLNYCFFILGLASNDAIYPKKIAADIPPAEDFTPPIKAPKRPKSFWRVKDKSAPHNVATSIAKIKEIAQRKNYRMTSDKKSGQKADTITIPYTNTNSNTVKYTYDAETQRYQRYSKGVEETDWNTGEKITTKNIIITFARNATLNDGEGKGRQTLYNVNNLKGYYITNGRAIEITCEKSSRSEQTVYKDLEGNEIDVNDGNTFVQICPIDAKVVIEGQEDLVEANTITEQ